MISLMTFIAWAGSFLLANAPLKIVLIGDSLTEGYGVARSQAYPALLEKMLGPEVVVVNSGVSGSTSASGPSRVRWALKGNPDLIVLALGANDGLRGLDPEAMRSNLEQSISLARAAHVQVVLLGMKAPPNYGPGYRRKFDRVFPEIAEEFRVPFDEFLLQDVGGIPKLNLADGIHPNEKGYEVIAQRLLPFFQKQIQKLKNKHEGKKK